jgi:5,10-methylenetetrahydromethanopterin reductase
MARASAIATLEQIAPGRLMVGFGTGFTGRAGMGKKPLSRASMRTHISQAKALLHGDIADIDGGLAQILASDGWLPDRPINVPIYMAGQGPKARVLAKESCVRRRTRRRSDAPKVRRSFNSRWPSTETLPGGGGRVPAR